MRAGALRVYFINAAWQISIFILNVENYSKSLRTSQASVKMYKFSETMNGT